MKEKKNNAIFEEADDSFENKPKMEIEINKYKLLVEVLNNPKMLAKIIIVLAVIIILVLAGVSAIALIIKRFYPYKAVETNKYGATVIKNEDNEVTYWLFNSADLWANSGIEVKKGQTITVKTSGAFHSAVHHLVHDAQNNVQSDKWLRPVGGMQSLTQQDTARSKYRIAPEYDFNAIIMQVIPKEVVNSGKEWFKNAKEEYLDYIDGGIDGASKANIYEIGAGYDNMEILEDGFLCFACNDIALTKRKIDKMKENVILDSITGKDRSIMNLGISTCNNTTMPELDYYENNNFVDAWFVDNVGSFLIVVERKK